jgi:hydrogenase expression/formation protein HypE
MSGVIVSEESPVLGCNESAFHASDTGSVRTPNELVVRMLQGKVPPEILQKIVFTKLGISDSDILLGPSLGEDASVIRIGDNVIIVATDPITGSISDVGWLAVHVNANDIATFGVRPRWFLASIMLPKDSTPEQLGEIMKQIDDAARILGIAVAGGHSEITKGIDRPIIAGFMIGMANNGEYVTSSGAQPGDAIILTKSIALEGSSIIATECEENLVSKVGADVIKSAKSLRTKISVVPEGVTAYETGYVTAMHDPTEGGFAGGIHEICDASNVGFEIYKDAIPIDDSTKAICDALEINPMELISSGCMIISCREEKATEVVNAIKSKGVAANVIGTIVKNPKHRIVITDSDSFNLPRPETDSLWIALKKINPS